MTDDVVKDSLITELHDAVMHISELNACINAISAERDGLAAILGDTAAHLMLALWSLKQWTGFPPDDNANAWIKSQRRDPDLLASRYWYESVKASCDARMVALKAEAREAEAALATAKADHEAQASRDAERIAKVLGELRRLYRAYVSLLETGRDRIVAQGGECDPVDVMEAASPPLVSARAVIAETRAVLQQESPDAN